MQNDDPVSEDVQILIQSMGFQTESIPESPPDKRPDFRVMMPEGDMIVEVKSKEDDRQLRRVLESSTSTIPSYEPFAILKKRLAEAWSQVEIFPDRKDEDFTLIWYVTRFSRGMTIRTSANLESLLYGTVLLEGKTINHEGYLKPCFAFVEPLFSKYRNLDGIVLQQPPTRGVLLPPRSPLKLCLNPCSYGYNGFKITSFANVFSTRFEVVDPPEMEAAGKWFMTARSVDMTNWNSVKQDLKSRYELDTIRVLAPMLFGLPAANE